MSGKPPPYVPLEEEGHPPPDQAPPPVNTSYQQPGPQQPGFGGHQGYPPPQQGPPRHPGWGPPLPQQGYPPHQGYPPPQQGYPPPHQQGYPPPAHGYPPPRPVMVVNNQPAPAPAHNTVVVNTTTRVQKPGINHCLHCCLSIIFPPWLFVWLCLCICD